MSEFVMTKTVKLKDQGSRDKIKNNLSVNMMVEAGAELLRSLPVVIEPLTK